MLSAEPAMFLLTCGVFAAAANVFALCLLGERMFLLVFGPKFNEEVWFMHHMKLPYEFWLLEIEHVNFENRHAGQ